MDPRDAHDVIDLLRQVLEEIQGMRKDYAEGQAVCMEIGEKFILSDIDSIEFNKPYEG